MASFLEQIVNSQAGALRTLEEVSWATNQGLLYLAHDKITIPSIGHKDIEIRIPAATKLIAMAFNLTNIQGDIGDIDDIIAELHENTTITTPGTIEIESHNTNRFEHSATTSDVEIFSNPIVPDVIVDGVNILKFVPAKAGEVNDITSGGAFFSMKPSTNYIWRYDKSLAPAATAVLRLIWLETPVQ